MVKDHSDSESGNPLPPHRLLFPISSKGSFICNHPTDRIIHYHGLLLHQENRPPEYIYIYIYIYTHTSYIYIYIYIYRKREREREERERERKNFVCKKTHSL